MLTIGVALPLTEELAEYGAAVRNGIALAQKKVPAQFEHIHLLFEDNKYEATASVTAFRRFEREKVDLIYSWGEVPFNAVAPLAERTGIPLAAMSFDVSPGLGKRFVIRTINDPRTVIAPLVTYLRSKGFRRFGIVKMEDPYINACVDAFQHNLRDGESVKIISTVLPGDTALKSQAILAKNSDVDALGVYLYPGQISAFYRQLLALKVALPTFGTDLFETNTEIVAAGGAIDGAVYPNLDMPEWFPSEYKRSYGNDAEIAYAYNAFAWAMITADIFKDLIARPTPEQIMSRYISVKGTEGGTTFRFVRSDNGDRYYDFPVVVKKIAQGQFSDMSR